jgi:hypothetical protein
MRPGGFSAVRGRRLIAVLAAGVLAVAGAGCGGDDDLAPEVPGPPADVVIPESPEAPTSAAGQDDAAATDDSGATTDDTGATTDDTGTTTDDTGTTTPEGTTPTPAPDESGATTTPEDTSGGTAAPDGEADSPTNDTPPPEGSNAEQFEDFCAQNPGAC